MNDVPRAEAIENSGKTTRRLAALLLAALLLAALLLAALLSISPAVAGEALPAPTLEGQTVKTLRHEIELAPTGLPKQIHIKAAPSEVPLPQRNKDAAPEAAVLRRIGRGAQLRAPLRLLAQVEGKEVEAEGTARIEAENGAVTVTAELQAAGRALAFAARYGRDGALTATLTGTGGGEVESLALAVDLAYVPDTLVVGPAVGDKPVALPASDFEPGAEDGLIWGNAEADAEKGGRAMPGVVPHLYVGDGDRGFTFLTRKEGWPVDPKVSSMTLTRGDAGTSWRILFVNHPQPVEQVKVDFALIPHPARMPAKNARQLAWLRWPDAAAQVMPVTLAARAELAGKPIACARADTAVANEGFVQYGLLAGPAGGDGLSAAQNPAAVCPLPLFRYLSGTHTGLTMRVRSNGVNLIRPGMNPAPDRVVIARALLHDIGLDGRGLAHLAEARRIAAALHEFGYFEADGQTETIPYWRSQALLRYGEAFDPESGLEVTEKDPNEEVRVTLYRRPYTQGRKTGYQVLFVVANENATPVRDRLFVPDPAAVFGGGNRLTLEAIRKSYDYSVVPPAGDWSLQYVKGGRANARVFHLRDLEDNGAVQGTKPKAGGAEIYGPLHIDGHDFRLLWGYWLP